MSLPFKDRLVWVLWDGHQRKLNPCPPLCFLGPSMYFWKAKGCNLGQTKALCPHHYSTPLSLHDSGSARHTGDVHSGGVLQESCSGISAYGKTSPVTANCCWVSPWNVLFTFSLCLSHSLWSMPFSISMFFLPYALVTQTQHGTYLSSLSKLYLTTLIAWPHVHM